MASLVTSQVFVYWYMHGVGTLRPESDWESGWL